MTTTILFNTKGQFSSFSGKNMREWLIEAILVKGKDIEKISLENLSVKGFLNTLKSILEERKVSINSKWVELLEDIYSMYLTPIKINVFQPESQEKLLFESGVGSNNIDLKKEGLTILSMNYWENKVNPNYCRIYVKVKDSQNHSYEYYIHKNKKRYPGKDFVESLSEYHLGDMIAKETAFTRCNSVEEMFSLKGIWPPSV